MSIFKNFLNRLLTWASHARTRSELLELDDRSLTDIGISREMLMQGRRAWPWRAPADEEAWHPLDRSHRYWQLDHAWAELNANQTVEPVKAGPGTEADHLEAA